MHTPWVTLTAAGGKDTRGHKGHSLTYYYTHTLYVRTYIHTYMPTLHMYIHACKRAAAGHSCHIHTYAHSRWKDIWGTLCDIQTHRYVTYRTIYTPKPMCCTHVCTDVRPAHRRCTMRHAVQKCMYCAPCVHQDSPWQYSPFSLPRCTYVTL